MSSASLVQRLLNEPTPHPLETSRVGALANCVDVFLTLEKLCEDKILILEAQKEVEPNLLRSGNCYQSYVAMVWTQLARYRESKKLLDQGTSTLDPPKSEGIEREAAMSSFSCGGRTRGTE
jgi:hypothetical protein